MESGMKPRRRYSVSQARNLMHRAVEQIVDPGPTDVEPLWRHFQNRCAYCGVGLTRADRKGHVDHADARGGNHIGNAVLACGTCNGDAKRELGWREFLEQIATDPRVFSEREARILAWFKLHPPLPVPASPEIDRLRDELNQVSVDFAAKCDQLRLAVRDARTGTA